MFELIQMLLVKASFDSYHLYVNMTVTSVADFSVSVVYFCLENSSNMTNR